MANIKSAMKRNRQNEKRRIRNRKVKSSMRTAVKRLRAAIDARDAEGANQHLPVAVRLVQRAASKGVIHANTASSKVSRLAKRIKAMATA